MNLPITDGPSAFNDPKYPLLGRGSAEDCLKGLGW